MTRILSLLGFVVFLASCSTTRAGRIYQNVESNKVEVGVLEEPSFNIELAYVGAIGHSYIFECFIENKSVHPIYLDKSNFSMFAGEQQLISPIVEEEVIVNLAKEKKRMKKQRKTETIVGALTVGLIAAIGASEGISPAETLLVTAEPIIYLFDDRRWYKNNLDGIDDEIDYIRAAQFNNISLMPQQSITRDILFPTFKINNDVDIIFTHDNHEYIITFPRQTFK